MFNLQGSEIIVILLLALVVLGPEKLPDAIRRFTQTYNELKKMGSGFQAELKSALDEPVREMRETAQAIQDAADPDKIAAAAHPAPGDPPLVEPEPEPAEEPARPVNEIAAANSSGALAAAARAADGDVDADVDADVEADRESADSDDVGAGVAVDDVADAPGGNGADRPAAGPQFHSAAPRRTVPPVPPTDEGGTEPDAGEEDAQHGGDGTEPGTRADGDDAGDASAPRETSDETART